MSYQPISTGLLAFGMSGRLFHGPFLHTHPGFQFCGVTERNQKKAGLIYPGLKSYATVEDLIRDPEIELVIVNTPNSLHFEQARQALLEGKHVLIEKPFTTTVEEALALYELAEKQKCYVLAYQNRRWDSDFLSVKQILESGRLGRLVEAHFRFDRYRPRIEPKAFKENPVAGSGQAFNLGPHLLDQAISLFGKPLEFRKTLAAHREGSKVDDYASFHLSYPGDLNVFITMSLLVARPLPAYVLHGSAGSYLKDRTDPQEQQLNEGLSPRDSSYGEDPEGAEGELTTINDQGEKILTYQKAPRGDYSQLFEAVYQQIRQEQPYPITSEHILWQLQMLQ